MGHISTHLPLNWFNNLKVDLFRKDSPEKCFFFERLSFCEENSLV